MSRAPAQPPASAADAHVLRERARILAQPPARALPAHELVELVEFRLADERYALETAHLQEVRPLRDLTPLPCTPAFVRGLVNLRGRLLAVIDLKKFFDLPEPGLTDLHQVLVLRGADIELGLLADTVESVFTLPRAALQPGLPTLHGIRADYLLGVTATGLVVLDATRILADPRLVVDEEVAAT